MTTNTTQLAGRSADSEQEIAYCQTQVEWWHREMRDAAFPTVDVDRYNTAFEQRNYWMDQLDLVLAGKL